MKKLTLSFLIVFLVSVSPLFSQVNSGTSNQSENSEKFNSFKDLALIHLRSLHWPNFCRTDPILKQFVKPIILNAICLSR